MNELDGWPTTPITPEEFRELIIKAAAMLDAQNVPTEGRFIKISVMWLRRRPKSKSKRIQKKWLKDPWGRFK